MDGKNLYDYLKKSFYSGSAKNLVVILSTLILLPLTVNKIGMNNYGLVMAPLIFGGFVVFADLGISKSVTYLISGRGSDGEIGRIVSSGILVSALVILIFGIATFSIVQFDLPVFGQKMAVQTGHTATIVTVGFFCLALMLLSNYLTAILEAFYLQHYINTGYAISSIAVNLFIYVTSLFTDSISALIVSPTAAFLLVALYYLYIVATKTTARLGDFDINTLKKMSLLSIGFLKINLISSLVIPANKYLIVFLTGNASALAIFDIALKIGLMSASMLNSMSQPLFAVFSNKNMSVKRVRKIAMNVSFGMIVGYILGVIAFYFVGPKILSFIDAENSSHLFNISFSLVLGLGFYACAEPYFRALLGVGALKASLNLKLLIPLINLILYFAIANESILDSVAYSYSASVFIAGLASIAYFTVFFKDRPSDAL